MDDKERTAHVTRWQRGNVEWEATGGYSDGSHTVADVVEFLTAKSEAPRIAARQEHWDHSSVEVWNSDADAVERALREAGVEFDRTFEIVKFRVSVAPPPRPTRPLR